MVSIKQKFYSIRLDDVIFYIAIGIPIFINLNVWLDILVSLYLCLAMIYFLNRKEYLLLLPIFLLYSPRLFLLSQGVSLVNIYALLYIIRWILKRKRKIKINIYSISIFVLFFYAFLVIYNYSTIYETFILFIGLWAMLCAINEFNYMLTTREKALFFKIYIFLCVSATIYGIVHDNIIMAYEEASTTINTMGRYSGTQNDPNYMAMFVCVGFALMLGLRYRNNFIKILWGLLLIVCLSFTGSMTGLLCCSISVIAQFLFNKKYSLWRKIIYLMIAILLIGLFLLYLLNNQNENEFFGVFSLRIKDILAELIQGNYEQVTSGRSEVQDYYIQYFLQIPTIRQLFGGYCINCYRLAGMPFTQIQVATHNTYLDIIFTCGILGIICLAIAVFSNLRQSIIKYKKEAGVISVLIAKLVILVFMTSLSVFPSWLYFFLLFII